MCSTKIKGQKTKDKRQKSKTEKWYVLHSKPTVHSFMHYQLALRLGSGDHIKAPRRARKKTALQGFFRREGSPEGRGDSGWSCQAAVRFGATE